MVIETGTALLIIGVFVLPGFFTLVFRERLYVVRGAETPFERLLSALFYSALIYGVVIAVGLRRGLDKQDLADFRAGHDDLSHYLGIGVVVFLVLPGLIAIIGSFWSSSKNVRPFILKCFGSSDAHSVTSAWNEVFSKQGPCLVRVTLTDGRVVGGFYDKPSMAAYSEQDRDLYINERWELDKDSWFKTAAPGSLGIWISKESIASLEIYESEDPVETETEKAAKKGEVD